jgi:hypothetical protein
MSKFTRGILASLFTVAAIAIATTSAASGAPVQWPGNGHYYEVVAAPGGISWPAASAAAQASTFNTTSGDLATITSGPENTFVFGLMTDPALWAAVGTGSRGPWIGGVQPAGSVEPDGGWQWVSGEPFVFSNWAAGEPNGGAGEDRIHFYNGTVGGGGAPIPGATWNDLDSANASVRSYVVEYVPDPAGAGLAWAMIVVVACASRRRGAIEGSSR